MIKTILVCISLVAASIGRAQTPPQADNEVKLTSIAHRVRAGDFGAFSDASNMEARVAVPYLFFQYINHGGGGEKPETVEAARVALRNVKGHGRYLEEILNRLHTGKTAIVDGFQEEQVFEALGSVGTMEAAAVVAPYLFRSGPNYKNPPTDALTSDYSTTAAFELARMKLPGSPVTYDPAVYQPPAVEKWRKWAIDHKLVSPEVVAAAPKVEPTPTPTTIPRLEPLLQQ
jgi:hypothetical protein